MRLCLCSETRWHAEAQSSPGRHCSYMRMMLPLQWGILLLSVIIKGIFTFLRTKMCLPTRKKNDLRLWGWSNCGCQYTAATKDCEFWSPPLTHAGGEALATLQPPFRWGLTGFRFISPCHKGHWPAHSKPVSWAKESPFPGSSPLPTTFHFWEGESAVSSGSGYSSPPHSGFRPVLEGNNNNLPPKYRTAQTNQVLEQNMPLTLSSLFLPDIISSTNNRHTGCLLANSFQIKMGEKDFPVATVFTQQSVRYRRNLGPNPGSCPKPTVTSSLTRSRNPWKRRGIWSRTKAN